MATLIKHKNKWFYSHKEYKTDNEFPGVVKAFAGTVDKIPEDWLLCDGAEYSVSDYPKLYEFLGNTYGGTEGSTFKVPDYRECVPVGAGQNDSDSMDAHDIYELGQFKDDQLQRMTGSYYVALRAQAISGCEYGLDGNGQNYWWGGQSSAYRLYSYFDTARVARSGTTSRGKQIGMNYIIRV